MKIWGIIGLGWLGNELARKLRASGHSVWGTQRADFTFRLTPFPQTKCDILFLNTPPLVSISPTNYANTVEANGAKRIVFISSTSVYRGASGIVTEANATQPTSAAAKWLCETEIELRKKFGAQLTVIRPGGLIGGKRHPIFSLSGKSQVEGGDQPVNLIHRDDLIQITEAVANAPTLEVINAVSPFHPLKSNYYKSWAAKLELPEPTFVNGPAAPQVDSMNLASIHKKWICKDLDFI